jgi:hypothetical protein
MREHGDTDDDRPIPGATHETRDISTRVVVIFGISLIVGAIVVHLAIWVLYVFYGSLQAKAYPREYPMAQVGTPTLPPAPRLQSQPREELKAMRVEEDRHLRSYEWVNPNGGTVHIPIDRAMQLLLQQGLPARSEPGAGQPAGMPQGSSSGRTRVPRERY